MVNRAGHPGAPQRPNGPNQNQIDAAQNRVINLALQRGIINQDQKRNAEAARLRFQTAHSNVSDLVPNLLQLLVSPRIVPNENARNALNQLIQEERQRLLNPQNQAPRQRPQAGQTNLAFQVPPSSVRPAMPNPAPAPAPLAGDLGMGDLGGLFGQSAFAFDPNAAPIDNDPNRITVNTPQFPPGQDPRELTMLQLAKAKEHFPDFNPGTDFEDIDNLGEGGMGIVKRVKYKILGREAAYKLMLPHISDQESIKRFQREARITARLDHPSIPPVYETGSTAEGQKYLLMKLVDGQDLEKVLGDFHRGARDFTQEEHLKELKDLLANFVKICEGVAYAHSQGIVHRDIKPANMMLGKFGEALLMDFGLAKDKFNFEEEINTSGSAGLQGGETERAPQLTQAGICLGTPPYMSKQAFTGEAEEQDDIYALGVTLSEILTDMQPVIGNDHVEIYEKVNRADVHPDSGVPDIKYPKDYNQTVPNELDAIVRKAIASEYEDRFQSVEDLIDALKAYLTGDDLPEDVYKYTTKEKGRRYLEKNASKLAVYALGSSLLATGGAGTALYSSANSKAIREELAKQKALREKDKAEAEKKIIEVERNRAIRTKKEIEKTKRNLIEANGLLALASLDQEKGRIGEMERRISAALEKYPIREFYAQAAGIYNNAGKYGSAIRNYKEALELAREEEKNGSKDAKNSIYEYLYKIHAATVEQSGKTGYVETEAMKELIAEAKERNDENEFTLLFKANKAYDRGEYRESQRLLTKAIDEKNPNLFALYNDLGNTYLKLGEVEKALGAFDQAVEVGRKVYFTYFNRAVARKNLLSNGYYGNPKTSEKARIAAKTAINDYDESISLKTNLQAGLSYKGEVYQIIGEDEQALVQFDESIRKFPNFSMAHLNSGSIYFAKAINARNGKNISKAVDYLNEAKERFTNAARLKPASTMVAFNLGNAYKTLADIEISQGKREEAIKNYKKAKTSYSKAADLGKTNDQDQNGKFAYATRAVANLAIAQHENSANRNELYEEALSDYQEFVRLLPTHPESTAIRQMITKLKRALGK